jgi:hypothetical protein
MCNPDVMKVDAWRYCRTDAVNDYLGIGANLAQSMGQIGLEGVRGEKII